MYRSGKPFHGSAKFFLYLLIHFLTTTLLTAVEVAQASTSQREIQEAQKTVGRFLRNGVGTAWLSELARTKSTPLKTEDILKELLRTTKPKGRVWRAASILSEALKGHKPESIIGRSDNWKDIIAGVEKEDDIICLYRKNTAETSKKSDDWQKFLKTVSPGYTVHVAIDTGLKYVICLKKLDAPEATSTDLSSLAETTSGSTETVTEATSATATTRTTTADAKPEMAPTSSTKSGWTSEKNVSKSRTESKCCGKMGPKEAEENERTMREAEEEIDKQDLEDAEEEIDSEDLKDEEENYIAGDSFENEQMEETEEMEEDPSEESGDYHGSAEEERRASTLPPTGLRRFNSMNLDRPGFPSTSASGGRGESIGEASIRDPECGRPIILVVQPGTSLMRFFPTPPFGLPVPSRLREPPESPFVPQTPAILSGWPRRAFHIPGSPNNNPRSMTSDNLVKPNQAFSTLVYERPPVQNFQRNMNFAYKLPSEETHVGRSVKKLIFQKNRDNFVSKVLHKEPLGVHRRPSVIAPRRVERLPQRAQEVKDIVIPWTKIPDRSDLIGYNYLPRLEQEKKKYHVPQLPINRVSSQSVPRVRIHKPILNSPLRRPMQSSADQFRRPWIFTGFPVQENPKVTRGLPVPSVDRTLPRLIKVIEPRQGQSTTKALSPATQGQLISKDVPVNGPCIKDHVGQHYSASCSSPCDRSTGLQIVIQEPSKLYVLPERGERAVIVESLNPGISHGSRSFASGRRGRGESREAREKIEPVVAEVERRMENVARKETERNKGSEDEAFKIDDKSLSEESESEEHSIAAGERFPDEMTLETDYSAKANSTASAVANSTIIA